MLNDPVRLMLRGWVTCGPAVRRALEETPEVSLVDMDWDERWALVRFVEPRRYGVEQLRTRLMLAGAWCDVWPEAAEGTWWIHRRSTAERKGS